MKNKEYHTLVLACLLKGVCEIFTVILVGYRTNQCGWMDRAQLMQKGILSRVHSLSKSWNSYQILEKRNAST